MRVLAVIPARFASTRFPGKPLVKIKGKSMIQRVYESCSESKLLNKVIVATDDDRIFNHLKEIGAEVMMTSPTHQNGTERIAEVAKHLTEFDLIINIQGDEPCIHPKQIEELVDLMTNRTEFEIGTLAKPIKDESIFENRNAVKAYFRNKTASSFERISEKKGNIDIGKHVGIYAFRRNTLLEIVNLEPTTSEIKLSLEQLRWLDNGYPIGITWTAYESPSVDIPEDLKKVELFMEKNKLK